MFKNECMDGILVSRDEIDNLNGPLDIFEDHESDMVYG